MCFENVTYLNVHVLIFSTNDTGLITLLIVMMSIRMNIESDCIILYKNKFLITTETTEWILYITCSYTWSFSFYTVILYISVPTTKEFSVTITVTNTISNNFNQTWVATIHEGQSLYNALQNLQSSDSSFRYDMILQERQSVVLQQGTPRYMSWSIAKQQNKE